MTLEPVDCSDGYTDTAPVGMYPVNAFGLHDVLGNVWEWTQDCWNGSYSGAPVDGGARRSGGCSRRVARGSSSYSGPGVPPFGEPPGARSLVRILCRRDPCRPHH